MARKLFGSLISFHRDSGQTQQQTSKQTKGEILVMFSRVVYYQKKREHGFNPGFCERK
jgi:hypothetical protein